MDHNTEKHQYKDGRRPPHFWSDIKIFEALKGEPTAFMVYCWILRRAGGHNGECFESNKSISIELGISLSCIKRSLKLLCDRNIVSRDSRPGQTTLFTATNADDWIINSEGGPNLAQVKSEPTWPKSGPGGGPNLAQGGGPNLAHKEDPIKEDPIKSFFKPEKSENDFQDFEQASPSVPEIPIPVNPSAEVSPPGGKGSAAAPVLYQSPNIPAYQTVNAQRWIQAWNKADRPGKWPAMSIGMMSSQRSLECLRQFIDHEGGDEDAAIATMLKRLVNAKKDPFWGSKPISAYVLTDPNKLFLAQFDAAPVAAEEEDDFVARMYRLYGDDQNAKP